MVSDWKPKGLYLASQKLWYPHLKPKSLNLPFNIQKLSYYLKNMKTAYFLFSLLLIFQKVLKPWHLDYTLGQTLEYTFRTESI